MRGCTGLVGNVLVSIEKQAELCSSCLWDKLGEGSIPESLRSQERCQAAPQIEYKKPHVVQTVKNLMGVE